MELFDTFSPASPVTTSLIIATLVVLLTAMLMGKKEQEPWSPTPLLGRPRDELVIPDGRPARLHEYKSKKLDSSRWNGINPRKDDIVIASICPSGTIWLRTMIYQILSAVDGVPASADVSKLVSAPAIDDVTAPKSEIAALERITHRRCLLTGLPADGIDYNPNGKYIFFTKDLRDTFLDPMAGYNNTTSKSNDDDVNDDDDDDVDALNATLMNMFQQGSTEFPWEQEGAPGLSLFRHARSWWQCAKSLSENFIGIHFNNVLHDPLGAMKELEKFLGVTVAQEKWDQLTETCSYEAMKALGTEPALDDSIEYGKQWTMDLAKETILEYDLAKVRKLAPGLTYFLEHCNYRGGLEVDEPREMLA